MYAPTAYCINVALLLQSVHIRAQVLEFDQVPIPAQHTLKTVYVFFVDSMKDAPDTSLGNPIVRFTNFSATTTLPRLPRLRSYKGIQLTLLRYSEFWKRINPMKMCSTLDDVREGTSQEVDQLIIHRDPGQELETMNVYSHTVYFRNATTDADLVHSEFLKSTGIYVLIFSNCGGVEEATVSGTLMVRNSYGFLPANQYPLMPFFSWLLLAYTCLVIGWLARSVRWWSHLFKIHHCITVVIFFGLLECALWSVYFRRWNALGVRTTRSTALFVAATLSTVVKSTFSYMLVLVAALGWGVTRPFLERNTLIKVVALCFLYIVLDSVREVVLSFRHSHALSLSFVLLCLLPVSLLNGIIFFWIFSALSRLMQKLQAEKQTEKLALFQKLLTILSLAIGIATFTILFEMYDLSRSISFSWRYQWLLTDGISHLLYLLVLTFMMYLWAPHGDSERLCYSEQIGEEDRDPSKAPDTAEALPEEAPDNLPTLQADVIGACDQGELRKAAQGDDESMIRA